MRCWATLSIVCQKGAEGTRECCRKQTACEHDTEVIWPPWLLEAHLRKLKELQKREQNEFLPQTALEGCQGPNYPLDKCSLSELTLRGRSEFTAHECHNSCLESTQPATVLLLFMAGRALLHEQVKADIFYHLIRLDS